MKNDFVIYSHSNSVPFAQQLAKNLTHEHKHMLNIGMVPPRVFKTDKQKFADGEINITFNESVRNKSLLFVAQIEMPYENLFELIEMLDAAKRCGANDITLVIPYLPHSRQERRDDKRSPITARIVADLLQKGADRILSMDLHTSAIEGLYTIPFDKLYPTDIFANHIMKMSNESFINLGLVSPDFGFMKKMEVYQNLLGCSMSVINKHRLKANEISKMELIGNVEGQNVVIIDDIIDTGGTLIKAADLLLEKGAIDVHVFATHAVLSGDAIKRLSDSKIKSINVSNTIDRKLNVKSLEEFGNTLKITKFNVIDVTPVFAQALAKIRE